MLLRDIITTLAVAPMIAAVISATVQNEELCLVQDGLPLNFMEEKKTPEQTKEEKKKGLLGKLQDITPDKEEQVALIGVAVRLGIVVWSGFILTLAYVDLPGFQKQNFDPTFIASVFTGALSTFGLATTKDKKSNGVSKEDMEAMIAKSNTAQTLSLIHISEPTRLLSISYAVFCL